MEGKENELMTKERICMWYKDWSSTVKFILHIYYHYSILPIYIVCMTKLAKLSSLLIFQVFDSIFIIN